MYSLCCRDFGQDCDKEFEAETFDKAWEDIKAHGKAEHGSTDEQLQSKEAIQTALKVCKIK